MGRTSFFVSLLSVASCALGADWIGEEKAGYQCKCYSDNACWPKTADWSKLNATVGGSLQVALPPGAVCHTALSLNNGGNAPNATSISTYNEAACAEVQAKFLDEQFL